ncbi:Transcription-repair coupling factor [Ligilactobacillus ruminis DPC 6832]|uniref:Transcription-repair coupling factor n=1 Tax=Ligilactobacillus ruminis DPC 6832 TaxID=1402208 RepID=A0A837DWR6_9LACO|nr:Transcription-repair coupling factor [Ligilactobacillus ruminis DPC 6832]
MEDRRQNDQNNHTDKILFAKNGKNSTGGIEIGFLGPQPINRRNHYANRQQRYDNRSSEAPLTQPIYTDSIKEISPK